MFVVDTNILVYAANEESEFHGEAYARLDEWRARRSPWYVTWGVCYEFMRVCTHPRVFPHPWTAPKAFDFIDSLLRTSELGLLTPGLRHREILAEVLGQVRGIRGNMLHDAMTVVLMKEHGIRTIYTRDTDFHRFPSIEVVDPLGKGSG